MTKSNGEKGQAVPLLVVALGLVLVGGMGLAIDAGNLYQQTQKAQVAADAAATAAALSIYQGVNADSTNPAHFSLSSGGSFTCTTGDAELPCAYARLNGFGGTGSDIVVVDAPACGGTPDPCAGIPSSGSGSLATGYTTSLVRVTITRDTHNTIMKMLRAADTTRIKAVGIAGIVETTTPVPILVTHPTLPQSFNLNGTTTLQICGGPSQSIQVNSNNAQAFNPVNGTVDLRYAGPNGQPDCSVTAGADFGVQGGLSTMPSEVLPGSGRYLSPKSWIPDPFKDVDPPAVPTTNAPIPVKVNNGQHGCVQLAGCTLFSPGLYTKNLSWVTPLPGFNSSPLNLSAITSKLGLPSNVLFQPGIYYLEYNQRNPSDTGVDFTAVSGGGTNFNSMCSDCPSDTNTGQGVLFYDSSANGSTVGNDPTGGFNVGTGANVEIIGPTLTTLDPLGNVVPGPPYYNIAFWEDRHANAHTGSIRHVIGTGNGCFTMHGATIYITNTREIMLADATHYQEVRYAGTPCSGTTNTGDIIVSTLSVEGSSVIKMNLIPYAWVHQFKVALMGGGPHAN